MDALDRQCWEEDCREHVLTQACLELLWNFCVCVVLYWKQILKSEIVETALMV